MALAGRLKHSALVTLTFAFVVLVGSGCAGPKMAPDLLANTERSQQPLVSNAVTIDVDINRDINNYERLDDTVRQSLEVALENANIFGGDASGLYRIEAKILIASQAAWGFGSFEGKLEIIYVLSDENQKKILEETIHTVAGSDKMYFSGAARHRRARAVNISENVLQFVEILRTKLKE